MGSPEEPDGELGNQDKETQHQMTLTKDFFMGVFDVPRSNRSG